MAGRVRQRGIQFPEDEHLHSADASAGATASPGSGRARNKKRAKRTAVFFLTTELWYAEASVLRILSSHSSLSYERALVCCSLTQPAHECDPMRPEPWGTTMNFSFRNYQRLLKQRLLDLSAASAAGSHPGASRRPRRRKRCYA